MQLSKQWATPEDFAILFLYLWHQDYPIDQLATGAKRSDWTIHIGIVVRRIADLMGLYARFEAGRRKDAVLRSSAGDEIAIEWEWTGVWGNELAKLKNHKIWMRDKGSESLLRYAVLVTYTHPPNIQKVYDHVLKEWEGARWPLLLILIDLDESTKFASRKEFKNINVSLFHQGKRQDVRVAPAFPWRIEGTRWATYHRDISSK